MSIKNTFGWVFMAAGVAGAGWVFYNIFLLFTSDSQPMIVQKLATIAGGRMLITTPGGNVAVPTEIFTLVAYGLAVILLAVAAYISVAFIKTATRLLDGDGSKPPGKLLKHLAKNKQQDS